MENKVSQLSEKDRPKVLYTYDFSNGKIQSSGGACYVAHMIDFAEAKDITSDNLGVWIELDPEYPIKENPKFTLYEEINEHGLTSSKKPLIGYGQWDSTEISRVVEKMKALPGFNTIDAVKNNKIYAMPWGLVSHCSWLATLYLAKIYHPELFGDLDIPAIHQEYIEKFLGLSPGAYKDSIFVYPTPDVW